VVTGYCTKDFYPNSKKSNYRRKMTVLKWKS